MKLFKLRKMAKNKSEAKSERLAKVLYFGLDKLHESVEHAFQDEVDTICFARKSDMVGREYTDFRFKVYSELLQDKGYSTSQIEEILNIWNV